MTDIVGVVRFSVLSTVKNPFALAKKKSFEDFARRILAPERLKRRFTLFEHVTLPSLDAQTDGDFALLVVAPERLTTVDRQRLEALEIGRPWLHVTYQAEQDFRMSQTDPLVMDLLGSGDAFASFRLDDDDAVSVDYIARLRNYVKPAYLGHSVSFCKGWLLDVGDGAGDVGLRPAVMPNIALGLAHIGRRKRRRWRRTLFAISDHHLRHHERAPTITDGRWDAFVALTHETNDTGGKRRVIDRRLTATDAQIELAAMGFNLDLIGLAETSVRGWGPAPAEEAPPSQID